MPFDGIVTKAIREELQEKVVGGRISKIYQPTDTELVFTIRNQRTNYSLLLSIHPTYARFHLTKDKYQNPQEPPMFCMLLRKYLSGAFIESIEQDGWSGTSTRRRSISGTTTTDAPRSRWCCRPGSPTCWSTARPGSPSGWPPTSPRTTCAKSPPVCSGCWRIPTPAPRSSSQR